MSLLFKNGRIFSPNGSTNTLNLLPCMIIHNGHVAFLGQEADLPSQVDEKASSQVIDLRDRVVLPGFIDGHMHLLLTGSSLQKVDLTPCKNLDDIRQKIKEAAKADFNASRILCKSDPNLPYYIHEYWWQDEEMLSKSRFLEHMNNCIPEERRPLLVCGTACLIHSDVSHWIY